MEHSWSCKGNSNPKKLPDVYSSGIFERMGSAHSALNAGVLLLAVPILKSAAEAKFTFREVVGKAPGGGNEGDPMVTDNEPGPEVGEPSGDGKEGDPMVTGNDLSPEVGEPPGSGEEGTPLAIGIELGPEMGEPPGNGEEGTLWPSALG